MAESKQTQETQKNTYATFLNTLTPSKHCSDRFLKSKVSADVVMLKGLPFHELFFYAIEPA